MDITSPMGITNRMHITRGTAITGLFVARGGRGVDWSKVTIRMSGRLNIIGTGRPPMDTGELGLAIHFISRGRDSEGVSRTRAA